ETVNGLSHYSPIASIASTHPPDLSPRAQAVATTKYIDLVQAIGAELNYVTGWRGEVAKRVGISGSLLSQILRGRKVTRGTLEKAILALKLDPGYFGENGEVEDIRAVPRSDVPPRRDAPRSPVYVDPLVVLEAYRALPKDTRKRLLSLLHLIDEE